MSEGKEIINIRERHKCGKGYNTIGNGKRATWEMH